MSRLRRTVFAAALALVLFASGAVVGVAVDRHRQRSHLAHTGAPLDDAHARHLEVFRVHLDLTDEQTRAVADIMARTRAQALEILTQERPALHELHERAQREVREVLTPEQAVEYERLIANHPHGMVHGH